MEERESLKLPLFSIFFWRDMTKHLLTDTSYASEERPLIGVVSNECEKVITQILPKVRQAGGIAVLIPGLADSTRLLSILYRCDGVILLQSESDTSTQNQVTDAIIATLRLGVPTIVIGKVLDTLSIPYGFSDKSVQLTDLNTDYLIAGVPTINSLNDKVIHQLISQAQHYHVARDLHDSEVVLTGCTPTHRLIDPLGRPLHATLVDGGIDYLCVTVVDGDQQSGHLCLTEKIEKAKRELRAKDNSIEIVSDLDDALSYQLTGSKAVILGLETTETPLSQKQLSDLSALQIKYLSLRATSQRTGRLSTPLSREEKKMIEQMNELGMTIDISGCDAQSTREILRISSQPVIDTGVVCEKFANHSSTLTRSDRILQEITEAGGVLMLTLPGEAPDNNAQDLAKMVAHVEALCGYPHIGISTGLCTHRWSGVNTPAMLMQVTMELCRMGMPAFKIASILGRNVLDVLTDNETHLERLSDD